MRTTTITSGLIIFILTLAPSAPTFSDDVTHVVADSFLDLRTGPGRGFPVFHVVEQGETILIDKRRTNWLRVRSEARFPVTGWVHVSQIQETGTTDPVTPAHRRWGWSVAGSDFAGASAISTALEYRFTRHLAIELEATQLLGEFSDGWMIVSSLQHTPFPNWRVSPYFRIGTGLLRTNPFTTIVKAEDRTDQTLNVGAGASVYLTRQFSIFLDYRHHTALTSRDDFEEIEEWKIGFSVFL